ncbi:hypothetical protein QTP86_023066, partial [Hemibagrus guttatus]
MSPFTLTRATLLESRMISVEYGKPAALFPRKVFPTSTTTTTLKPRNDTEEHTLTAMAHVCLSDTCLSGNATD